MSADRIVAIEERLDYMRESLDDLREAMRTMAAAVTRLAVIEERQSAISSALDRLFKTAEEIESRVRVLELESPRSKMISVWVERVALAVFTAIATTLVGRLM